MSPDANTTVIDGLVVASARALFGAHGLELGEPEEGELDTPRDYDVAASIGFTSPQAQGAILMTTRKDIVATAWPRELRKGDREPTEREACDWAGELVNQLLGRVKNALLPYGLTLEQSTPTVVTGRHVHRAPASTSVARRYFFVVTIGSLIIYFDAALADGLALSDSGDANNRPAPEGDVHLF
jgi:CheY-specific phosphatase CheX